LTDLKASKEDKIDMPKKKAKAKAERSVQTALSGNGPVGIDQVDDPIIIKGGSITITFGDNTRWKKDTADPKNKFDHVNAGKQLSQLLLLRKNATSGEHEPLPINAANGRVTLQREDIIMICFSNSLCLPL
jgi:hypothetical protein